MIFTDQLMREVRLQKPPSRIVSLVPSITELLSDLGLDNAIAGITKFCVHPEHIFHSKPRVGGTKKVDHEKIHKLEPDLIIANKEENIRADIELLEKKYPVWISDVKTLRDAVEMISGIGTITGKSEIAESLNKSIISQFQTIKPLTGTSVLYLIWKKPYMAAGNDTFINAMLESCGLNNFLDKKIRYPELTGKDIEQLHPEVVMLSSEPYPFSEKHINELSAVFPSSKIIVVDGTYFSWYGSRLEKAPEYFNALLTRIRFFKKQIPLHED